MIYGGSMRYLSLILLCCAAVLAQPVLVGVNEQGEALRLGSGWGGADTYFRPFVQDDGSVYFLAPEDTTGGKTSSVITNWRGIYRSSGYGASPVTASVWRSSFNQKDYDIAVMLSHITGIIPNPLD